eukprot:CAMPEP_0172742480 /NCGR_PEP_ID=MMETSP1074-20121228/129638_1 /TAXON_ID=2916 /ORGANISM="Ceratium fusus, Strain PA161109" /LENGTH=67 /DNA_ID=CAMNT_0013573027 /DNA_START=1 /DNA_END=201 /DNA_ORIENTATION=-
MLEDLESRCVRDRLEQAGESVGSSVDCQELRANSEWLRDQQMEEELLQDAMSSCEELLRSALEAPCH